MQFVWSTSFRTERSKPFAAAIERASAITASLRARARVKIQSPASLVPLPVRQPPSASTFGGPPAMSA